MTEQTRYRFIVDGVRMSELPMRDVASYIADLSDLLGNEPKVHIDSITESSLCLAYRVERGVDAAVRERLAAASRDDDAAGGRSKFIDINARLKAHRASARLIRDPDPISGGVERVIAHFPGIKEPEPEVFTVNQSGELDGVPIGVFTTRLDADWVNVRLRGEGVTHLCRAAPPLAQDIAKLLFTSAIRVRGKGRWTRDPKHGWKVDQFTIRDFEVLDDRPLGEVVSLLRESYRGTDWAKMDDPIAELQALRSDP